jgi:hypothetical protein
MARPIARRQGAAVPAKCELIGKIQPSRWSESQETPSFQGVPRSVLADSAEKQGLAATKAVQIAACAVFRKEIPNTVA